MEYPHCIRCYKSTLETVIPNRYVAKNRQVVCCKCHALPAGCAHLSQITPPAPRARRRAGATWQNLHFASLMPVNALYYGGYAISWGVNSCLLDDLKDCQWHKLSQSLFFID